MPIKFFADTHIAIDTIEALQRKGIDIIRSLDAGFAEDEDDRVLLSYATSEKRIMVTCDNGFERHRVEWLESGRPHASILYFNMSTGQCSDIGLMVTEIEFIHEAADSEKDIYNQFWRVKS